MSLVRDVRQLGPISTISNFAILSGYVALVTFFYLDFEKLSDASVMPLWGTLPTFLAGTTANYEGIGTIIPIESSMTGARHRYPKFLHSALMLVTCLLAFFGISGYCRYGSIVDQVITVTLSRTCSHDQMIIVQVVNMMLCLGILFTFPLHMFVIIETLEPVVFGPCYGKEKSVPPSRQRSHSIASTTPEHFSDSRTSLEAEIDELVDSLNQELQPSYYSELQDSIENYPSSTPLTSPVTSPGNTEADEGVDDLTISVPQAIPADIPLWQRNAFRILLVIFTATLAMFLKDYFYYVLAVTGALGSVLLAYVLPCIFHIQLCPNDMTRFVYIKDIAIIIFGILAGVAGLYSVVNAFL